MAILFSARLVRMKQVKRKCSAWGTKGHCTRTRVSNEADSRLGGLIFYAMVATLASTALFCLLLSLVYEGRIQATLKEYLPSIPNPTVLVWPTAEPTKTLTPFVIPTRTPTPTPTLLEEIRLSNDEIGTIAAAIAYEALGEPLEGRTAVGYVIMHRCILTGRVPSEVLTREFFGSDVGADFIARMKEWWKPDNNNISLDDWQQITIVAINVANGWSYDEFPTSTHFYSMCLMEQPPSWQRHAYFLGFIGCHKFYSIPR